jgi:preprotein translocase subunit SecD
VNTYTEQDLRAALTSLAEPDPGPVDVWTPLQSRIVRRRYSRLGAVAALAAAAVAVAIVGWPGGRSPDSLRVAGDGTTVVTLTADRQLSKAELNTTVDVLRQRMSALGVTGELRTAGDVVTLSVAAADTDLVSALGARGEVQWRQVLEVKAGTGAGDGWATAGDLTSAESTFQQRDCPTSGASGGASSTVIPAGSYLVTCNADGTTKYLLAPSVIGNADIDSADTQQDSIAGAWPVDVGFTHSGAEAWRQLTAHVVQQPQPQQCRPPGGCNSIGVVVDGQIIATPSVVSGPGGIIGGETQITGPASQNEARVLAAEISAPPLPTPMAASAGSTATADPSPCSKSFELSLVSDRNGQPTPEKAAEWFAAHGGIGDIPAAGWHTTSGSTGTATVQSGNSTLHVIQGPDQTWQVDSGHNCG